MTKYLVMQHYSGPADLQPMTEWALADTRAHVDFQLAFNKELTERGELLDAQGLTGPDLARFVTWTGAGTPVVAEGPFPQSQALLAGYRLIDVASDARALEIAATASAAPGPGGRPLGMSIELRQVMDMPAAGEG